jgi:hypothetical protein
MGVISGLGADSLLVTIYAKSALQNGEIQAEELRSGILTVLPCVDDPRASPSFLPQRN